MRLDHLLSREIRAPTLGGVGALMAPWLIARSIVPPARWGTRAPATAREIEATWRETPFGRPIREFLPLF